MSERFFKIEPDADLKDDFVGREHLIETIDYTLDSDDGVMISLWGSGGIGKTTLLYQLYDKYQNRKDYICIGISFGNNKTVVKSHTPENILRHIWQSLFLEVKVKGNDTQLSKHIGDEYSLEDLYTVVKLQLEQALEDGFKILFLIDNNNQAERYLREFWFDFIDKIVKPLYSEGGSIVFVGRSKAWDNPELIRKDYPPLPGRIKYLSLEGLNIIDLKKAVQKWKHTLAEKHDKVNLLHQITGGHPGLSKALVLGVDSEEFNREKLIKNSEKKWIELIERETPDTLEAKISISEEHLIKLMKYLSLLFIITEGWLDSIDLRFFPDNDLAINIQELKIIHLVRYHNELFNYIFDTTLKISAQSALPKDEQIEFLAWAFERRFSSLKENPRNSWVYALELLFLICHWIQRESEDKREKLLEKFESSLQDLENISEIGRQVHFDESAYFEINSGIDKHFLSFNKKYHHLAIIAFKNWLNRNSDIPHEKSRLEHSNIGASHVKPFELDDGDRRPNLNRKLKPAYDVYPAPENMVGVKRGEILNDILDFLNGYGKRVIEITGQGGYGKTEMLRQIIAHGRKREFITDLVFTDLIDLAEVVQPTPERLMKIILSQVSDIESPEQEIFRRIVGNSDKTSIEAFMKQMNAESPRQVGKEIIRKILEDGPLNSRTTLYSILGNKYVQNNQENWLETYNSAVEKNKGCWVVICFDSVEYVRQNSKLFEWMENYLPKMKRTSFIFGGRLYLSPDEEQSSHFRMLIKKILKQSEKGYRLHKQIQKLGNQDSELYIRASYRSANREYKLTKKKLENMILAGNGHPVMISMLLGLAENVQNEIFVELKNKKEELKRKEEGAFSGYAFKLISEAFLRYMQQDFVAKPIFYRLLLTAKRGITPSLVQFVLSERGENYSLEEIKFSLNEWKKKNIPLIKVHKFYRKNERITGDTIFVPHDVFFDIHYVRAAIERPTINKERAAIIKYYEEKLLPELRDKQHVRRYQSKVSDLLYYKYSMHIDEGYIFLIRETDIAVRSYQWKFANRLWQEWNNYCVQCDYAYNNKQYSVEKDVIWSLQLFYKYICGHDYRKAKEIFENHLKNDKNPLDKIKNSEAKLFYKYSFKRAKQISQIFMAGAVNEKNPEQDLSEALEVLNKRINTFSEKKINGFENLLALADDYRLRANLWLFYHRYDIACQDLIKAHSIYKEINYFVCIIKTLADLSTLYAKMGEVLRARLYLQQIGEAKWNIGPATKYANLRAESELKIITGDYSEAKKDLSEMVEIFLSCFGHDGDLEANRMYHELSYRNLKSLSPNTSTKKILFNDELYLESDRWDMSTYPLILFDILLDGVELRLDWLERDMTKIQDSLILSCLNKVDQALSEANRYYNVFQKLENWESSGQYLRKAKVAVATAQHKLISSLLSNSTCKTIDMPSQDALSKIYSQAETAHDYLQKARSQIVEQSRQLVLMGASLSSMDSIEKWMPDMVLVEARLNKLDGYLELLVSNNVNDVASSLEKFGAYLDLKNKLGYPNYPETISFYAKLFELNFPEKDIKDISDSEKIVSGNTRILAGLLELVV